MAFALRAAGPTTDSHSAKEEDLSPFTGEWQLALPQLGAES